jgi:hypothetical protein
MVVYISGMSWVGTHGSSDNNIQEWGTNAESHFFLGRSFSLLEELVNALQGKRFHVTRHREKQIRLERRWQKLLYRSSGSFSPCRGYKVHRWPFIYVLQSAATPAFARTGCLPFSH